jgi:undecaprenyl-diphosphatase
MNVIDALILGIVEGVTEFLPVSSTGHMILTSHILGISDDPFTKSFEIVIQLGAILAVVYLYRKTLYTDMQTLLKVAVAFIPTAVIGLLLYSTVKKYFLGNDAIVVGALFIGGVALVLFEKYTNTKNIIPQITESSLLENISYKKALSVGLWQTLALVPGVSRSAATIVGGETLGISRKSIVDFSFLLAIPTLCAASALDVYKHADVFIGANYSLLGVGFFTAFVVALFSIKSFLSYIQNHSFAVFGYYRIILAVLYGIFFL